MSEREGETERGGEGRGGAHPSSERYSQIYRLAVPVVEYT